MRIIVFGAGAVGGVVGARLHLAGHDVQLVARGAHLDAIRRDGLRLEHPGGTEVVRVPAAASLADLVVHDDTVVLLAVKGQQTPAAIVDIVAHAPHARVASLQNGVANERALLRHFADVVAITVMLPATHLEPGVVIQGSAGVPGLLDLGRYPSGADATAHELAAALRDAGFESVVREDAMAWKHRKLVANLQNGVQAAFAPGDARTRLGEAVHAEAEALLAAVGVPVVDAAVDRERRAGRLEVPRSTRGGSSTWQSLERGTGSVETAMLNGEITLLGRLHGIPTPANDLVGRAMAALAASSARPGGLDAADALAELGIA